MKRKGIELKEITEPQIFDPPKKMLVWDCDRTYCTNDIPNLIKKKVIAILPKVFANRIVLTINNDNRYSSYAHCAEIPEEPKPRRATNRELAKWLAQGNGEYTWEHDKEIRHHFFGGHSYVHGHDDELVDDAMRIRKWADTEWHEPTVDYMGIEA